MAGQFIQNSWFFSDPNKYRFVHLKLKNIIAGYTSDFAPKSIDEFVPNLKDYIHMYKVSPYTYTMQGIAKKIKQKIKKEIGNWITVSIGIAPNRYLAKVAAGLKKPDGLEEICKANVLNVYSN